jgi:hypothetical protein
MTFVLALVILGGVRELPGQELQIGIIDFYGLNRTSASQAHQALTFKEGDIISLEGIGPPAFLAESERRLSNLPGIAQPARVRTLQSQHVNRYDSAADRRRRCSSVPRAPPISSR